MEFNLKFLWNLIKAHVDLANSIIFIGQIEKLLEIYRVFQMPNNIISQ